MKDSFPGYYPLSNDQMKAVSIQPLFWRFEI